MQTVPNIRKHLLWEYSWKKVDFTKLSTVVIERVIERGNLNDWQAIIEYYGKLKITAVAEKSTRLDAKSKNFTPIFLQSEFLL